MTKYFLLLRIKLVSKELEYLRSEDRDLGRCVLHNFVFNHENEKKVLISF